MTAKTAVSHPDHSTPDLLPIWARLALIAQNVPFDQVTFWEREEETQICAYLAPYGYVLLHKRQGDHR